MTSRSSLRCLTLAVAVVWCVPAVMAQEAAPTAEEKKEGLPLEPERKIEFVTSEATWLSLDVSPDGTSIVFELVGDLYSLPIAGGQATAITTGMAFDSQPRFSPDGKSIVFLSDRDGSENVWVANADGTNSRKLSRDQSTDFASPTWSADGTYIIVSRQPGGANTYELWMYHTRGGGGVQITKAKPKPDTPGNRRLNAMGPAASPDGRYVYYARRLGGFQYNASFPLWQVARRDLTTGDEDVLTPDGAAIAARIPGADHLALGAAGHALTIEQGPRLAAAILAHTRAHA